MSSTAVILFMMSLSAFGSSMTREACDAYFGYHELNEFVTDVNYSYLLNLPV